MLYKNQQLSSFIKKLLLVFFIFSSTASAKTIQFDPSLSEFVLKNALSLQYQIKQKRGLGYTSLLKQTELYGCEKSLLSSPLLVNESESYEFHQNLIKLLRQCPDSTFDQNEYQIELNSLLDKKEPYLVIAGESLKSPMSYFGHSLIVFLDKDNFYFSPVISILAPTEDLTVIEQFGKGGFSFIKAEMNTIPLHQIIDFYSEKESRDLQFIKLPQNEFNRKKLIEYFNDKISVNLTYNFFTQNCSTYLRQALNYSCNCLVNEPKIVTPVQLIKDVLEQNEKTFIFSIDSLFNEFNNSYLSLNSSERSLTKDIFLNDEVGYPDDSKKSGYTAAIASRLSFKTYGSPNRAYGRVINTFGEDSSLLNKPPSEYFYKEEEKDGLEVSSIKSIMSEDTFNIKISTVDFDHFEQRIHHFTSSKLSAGSVELSEKNKSLSLEALDLINIRSITPVNFVTKTPSWRLRVGAERDDNRSLKSILSGGIGASFSANNMIFFVLPSLELKSSIEYPVYSGILFHSELLSIKYESRNFEDHKISIYRRENNYFGYEYSLSDEKETEKLHNLTFSYYF